MSLADMTGSDRPNLSQDDYVCTYGLDVDVINTPITDSYGFRQDGLLAVGKKKAVDGFRTKHTPQPGCYVNEAKRNDGQAPPVPNVQYADCDQKGFGHLFKGAFAPMAAGVYLRRNASVQVGEYFYTEQ